MSNFSNKLFSSEEKISIEKILFSIFAISTIRAFVENYSSPSPSQFFFSWRDLYLQFPLYYISIFLSFGLLLYFFTKKALAQIINFEIKIFLIALLPPIIDLLLTSGKGSQISYLLIEPKDFFSTFFKTMNPLGYEGITAGIHIAAYLILAAFSIFVFKSTQNIFKSITTALVGYIILFSYAILPSIIALPQFLIDKSASIPQSYIKTINESWLITTGEKTNPSFLFQLQPINFIEQYTNEPTTQIFFLFIFLQLIAYLFIFNKKFLNEIKRNLRLERILYWFIIACIGIIIGIKNFSEINFSNTINIITLLIFLTLIMLNIWLAVCVNDQEDIEIDKISNPDRPLVKKTVSLEEWHYFQIILLTLIAFGTAIMNHAVAFLLITAQTSYYIYSAKPLRLKHHFLTSSILIGISSVVISMAGFFLVSPDQHLKAFPIKAVFIIGITYALISNFKDIKDFFGDKHEGIQTMPVVFGLRNSKIIIATLFAIVIISVPIIMKIYAMLLPSVIISIFLYYLFIKKEYQEKYIFLTFFLYAISLFIATL